MVLRDGLRDVTKESISNNISVGIKFLKNHENSGLLIFNHFTLFGPSSWINGRKILVKMSIFGLKVEKRI